MTANLLYLLNDNSTYANYSSWAGQMSTQLALAGWAQSTDTGQVMWTGMTISACTAGGGNGVYTYSALTGFALQNGRALTITGMSNAINNGVKIITSFTGTTSGTFTVVNASAITESSSSGVVTAQSTVPTTNTYLYEIWVPNDSLTSFYLKVEYGNFSSGTNAPTIAATIGGTTNGAGTLVGLTTGRFVGAVSANAGSSSTVPVECRFSGGASYFGAMLWRGINNGQLLYVERSVNSSGAYTNSNVTLVVIGAAGTTQACSASQQTYTLQGLGPAPAVCLSSNTNNTNYLGLSLRSSNPRTSLVFNNSVPFDTLAPVIGYYDYPLYGIGSTNYLNVTEGQILVTSVYGVNHTYICTQAYPFSYAIVGAGSSAAGQALAMRYE